MKKFTLVLMSAFFISLFIISAFNTSAIIVDTENQYKYDKNIISQIFQEYELTDPDLYVVYKELYEYYSDGSSADETYYPEYILIYVGSVNYADSFSTDLFGEFVLYDTDIGYPFAYEYGIYVPATNEVYDLVQAYKLQIEGIEKVFTEYGIGRLIGDVDKDRKITIKDATCIQKCLAGISEFDSNDYIHAFVYEKTPPLLYISDFNRDCKRNIKDATAIQKYLAKIDS